MYAVTANLPQALSHGAAKGDTLRAFLHPWFTASTPFVPDGDGDPRETVLLSIGAGAETHSQRDGGARWVFTMQGVCAPYWPGRWCSGGVALASVVAGSLPASAAPAVSLYVAVGGTGDCTTAADACASIQTAINGPTDISVGRKRPV